MAEDAVADAPRNESKRERESRNPFVAIVTFLKQVVVELSKVVTPTRKELVNYTIVVLCFVVIMMLLVSGLDFVFGSLVGTVFGDQPLFG
ncbi:preprotein translocase subunit SecE [Humidisolicoccus flavus]|uniref:preprotein translocase subunit SecE n=1 Tax=Humidisolicoccus flavus TaxID=3111414 RepID=UPI00324AC2EB